MHSRSEVVPQKHDVGVKTIKPNGRQGRTFTVGKPAWGCGKVDTLVSLQRCALY